MSDRPTPDLRTLAIHAGEDPSEGLGEVAPSIAMSTSFRAHPDGVQFSAEALGEDSPFFYTRWGNPTVRQLEEKLAALDEGEDALCFASGMAAISALLLSRLKAGDHLVISDVCYAGVAELVHKSLPQYGIAVSCVDTGNLQAVREALRPQTRLIYAETPANPILRLADIAGLSEVAKAAGVELAIDSTLATAVATRPLTLGADYVIHSLTKYVCGHGGDALGGVVIGEAKAMAALRQGALIHLGGCISPFNAWLCLRSLHTLELRMRAHEENSFWVARFLEQHPRVARVLYPGLPSHPQHDLARRQMANFSGMVSFSAADGASLARKLADGLEVVSYAVSMGKSKTLVFYIPTDDLQESSFKLSSEALASYREWTGEGCFRMSIGLESPEAIVSDLARVLDAA
ncbi:MAG: aminotransferase class I/II-fold pyridoxal phosphate-dependent enzyme [Kiloniellales bacterium]